jgi:hypothetical protein
MASSPSWADRQLALLKDTGSPQEMVRRLISEARVSTPSDPAAKRPREAAGQPK